MLDIPKIQWSRIVEEAGYIFVKEILPACAGKSVVDITVNRTTFYNGRMILVRLTFDGSNGDIEVTARLKLGSYERGRALVLERVERVFEIDRKDGSPIDAHKMWEKQHEAGKRASVTK